MNRVPTIGPSGHSCIDEVIAMLKTRLANIDIAIVEVARLREEHRFAQRHAELAYGAPVVPHATETSVFEQGMTTLQVPIGASGLP